MNDAEFIVIDDLDPAPWETEVTNWTHFECGICGFVCMTESGLWSHTKRSHRSILPQSAEDRERFRAEMKVLCQRQRFPSTPQGVAPEGALASYPSATERVPDASEDASRAGYHSQKIIQEPVSWLVPQDQLMREVNEIYPCLVLVEKAFQDKVKMVTDCCLRGSPMLADEKWKALIKLHNVLLEQAHDFVVASQHPGAHAPLRQLAVKYQIPSRAWDSIRKLLDLLFWGLPHSRGHMIGFIDSSYGFLRKMSEGFPEFRETWLAAKTDTASYRLRIMDDDIDEQKKWAKIARKGYLEIADSDKTSCAGRLYFQLAFLSKFDILTHLFYYCKSLDVSYPFLPTQEEGGIAALFASVPELDDSDGITIDEIFVYFHGVNFRYIQQKRWRGILDASLLFANLPYRIQGPGKNWEIPGAYMAVCSITGLYEYGAEDSFMRLASRGERKGKVRTPAAPPPVAGNIFTDLGLADLGLGPDIELELNDPDLDLDIGLIDFEIDLNNLDLDLNTDIDIHGTPPPPPLPLPKTWDIICAETKTQRPTVSVGEEESIRFSKMLAYGVLKVVLRHTKHLTVLPHVHVWLAFLARISCFSPAMRHIVDGFPWGSLVTMLNGLLEIHKCDRFEGDFFPLPEKGTAEPLPEDYVIRGLDWASDYFPDGWFQVTQGREDQVLEKPRTRKDRIERILWLAVCLSTSGEWLTYSDRQFKVHPGLDKEKHKKKWDNEIMPPPPFSGNKRKPKVIIGEGYYMAGGRSRKKVRSGTDPETIAGPSRAGPSRE